MGLRQMSRVPGSVFDLAVLDSLPNDDGQVLIVSSRTLYLLANLAAIDVVLYSRYATGWGDGGYYQPVDENSADAETVDEIANRFGIEVQPVSDIRPIRSMTAVRSGSDLAIATATVTPLAFTSFDDLPADFISYASNVFTVERSGRLLITGSVLWQGHATGLRQARVRINGTLEYVDNIVPGSALVLSNHVSFAPNLAAGDTIQIDVYQTSGGNLSVLGTTAPPYSTSFSLVGF